VTQPALAPRTAFVLGGGGILGASQVGMLRALGEAGIVPDVVLGTSVGAINGAMVAARPGRECVDALTSLWSDLAGSDVFGASLLAQTATLLRTRTNLHSSVPLRRMLTDHLGDVRIEDLALPFECVAAHIETAAEHWFSSGPVVEAVLASSAVPGLLPPVEIGSGHFLDGGLVNSIPVDRAVDLGVDVAYVLQVGRIEAPLRPPRQPLEVGLVAFEIARRHRFATTMTRLPDGIKVHVLPTGTEPLPFSDRRQFRYRDFEAIPDRIEAAYVAGKSYLAELSAGDHR
jgi:NTE family protein